MSERLKTSWNTRTLVYMALMIAVQIILSRLLAINIGSLIRLSFGPVATVLSGLWFGPVAGGLCGLCADLTGFLIFNNGGMLNPLITAAAVLWGVLPSIAVRSLPLTSDKKKRTIVLCASILVTGIISSLFLNTLGQVLYYSFDPRAVLIQRLPQFAVMIPCYCLLTCLLYFSPLTGMVLHATAPSSTAFHKS